MAIIAVDHNIVQPSPLVFNSFITPNRRPVITQQWFPSPAPPPWHSPPPYIYTSGLMHCLSFCVCLVSEHNVSQAHPRCSLCQHFLPLTGWVLLHARMCHAMFVYTLIRLQQAPGLFPLHQALYISNLASSSQEFDDGNTTMAHFLGFHIFTSSIYPNIYI